MIFRFRYSSTFTMSYFYKKRSALITVATILTLSACNKDNEPDNLPLTLREEFSCHINGEYWAREGGGCRSLDGVYFLGAGVKGDNPAGNLKVTAENCSTRDRFLVGMDSVFSTGVYSLPKYSFSTSFIHWEAALKDTQEVYPIEFYIYEILKGEVVINEFALPNRYREDTNYTSEFDLGWVKGTFELTLCNGWEDTLHITNGQFASILR